MIIKNPKHTKQFGPMKISEYKINTKFSAALIEINGNHGTIKCIGEDMIYFIIEGSGEFVLDGKTSKVTANDLIFVPENTPYNIICKMKYLIVHSPEFNPKHDVLL